MAEESINQDLELRKVRALEKIARNLDSIAICLELMEPEEWNARLQWYLDMFKKAYLDPKLEKKEIIG